MRRLTLRAKVQGRFPNRVQKLGPVHLLDTAGSDTGTGVALLLHAALNHHPNTSQIPEPQPKKG